MHVQQDQAFRLRQLVLRRKASKGGAPAGRPRPVVAVFGARSGVGCSAICLGLARLFVGSGWDVSLSCENPGRSRTQKGDPLPDLVFPGEPEHKDWGTAFWLGQELCGPEVASASTRLSLRVIDLGTRSPADAESEARNGRILLVAAVDPPGLMQAYAWLKSADKVGVLQRTAIVFNGLTEDMSLAEASERIQTAARRFLAQEVPVWAGLPWVPEGLPPFSDVDHRSAGLQSRFCSQTPSGPDSGPQLGPVEVTAWQDAASPLLHAWWRGLSTTVDCLSDAWAEELDPTGTMDEWRQSRGAAFPPQAGAA